MDGAPIRVLTQRGLRDRYGPVHAGTFVRERTVRLDCTAAEFPRIFVHEVFHFVWLRLGNPRRLEFESQVSAERLAGAAGELGWSAEWRKNSLSAADIRRRTRLWREYCCESFCDTAAWLYSGVGRHPEFTLPAHFRQQRRAWFRKRIESMRLSI